MGGIIESERFAGGPAPDGKSWVPNITPAGLGRWGSDKIAWSEKDIAGFLSDGMNPGGDYAGGSMAEVIQNTSLLSSDDRAAIANYIASLPPVAGRARRHELGFPFNIRRLVGFWKLLFFHEAQFTPDPTQSAPWNRGAYLVNGPGHCAECHSPRNMLGAIVESERFAGGPTPDGKGFVPNITSVGLQHWGDDNVAWSQKDITSYLADGMNPAGDFAGSGMAEVIRNTEALSAADREAIAVYIASLPPRQGPKRPAKTQK
jgi:mono/diheme cytochrome c family protein